MSKQESIKYIYILSQRYSGSTLLSTLLATYPEISTIGERRKFYNKLIKNKEFSSHRGKVCSCGNSFEECSYLNELKANTLKKIDPNWLSCNTTEFYFSKNKYINELSTALVDFYVTNRIPLSLSPVNRRLRQLLDFNLTLVQEILKLDNNQIFVDSSKDAKHLLFLSQIKELDLNVVWLNKDPRGQVNSALKYNKSWDISFAIENWKKQMVKNERLLKKLNLKHIRLRYEDLCKNPVAKLKEIFDFTGVNIEKIDLDFRKKEQHMMGNGKMLLGKEKDIKERTEWKKELTESQISQIEKQTSNYAHLYS